MTAKSEAKPRISLSGMILAGGQSSRMGEDKALLIINNVPLLQIVYNVASALCDPVYVVTPWPERYQNLAEASLFIQEVPLDVEITSDVISSSSKLTSPLPHGPLIGFAQGLAYVQTEWVLLLACDLPKLQVELLQEWVIELERVEAEVLAVLTRHNKGWEPLCGFYRASCLPALTNYIKHGGRSFQHWLTQHPVQVLPLHDPQILFNCNTPDDFANLERLN